MLLSRRRVANVGLQFVFRRWKHLSLSLSLSLYLSLSIYIYIYNVYIRLSLSVCAFDFKVLETCLNVNICVYVSLFLFHSVLHYLQMALSRMYSLVAVRRHWVGCLLWLGCIHKKPQENNARANFLLLFFAKHRIIWFELRNYSPNLTPWGT